MDNTSMSKLMMPLMRTVMPKMVATELVGVQPLSGPSGQVYGRQFRMKRKRKMRQTIQGYSFQEWQPQWVQQLPKEEVEIIWLQEGIKLITKTLKEGNINTSAEKWKENRKKMKKALNKRTKRLKLLEDNFPHRFI